ncbi:MAG TPA: hypothetical protein VFU22_02640 [Roseiflexaceae bacterium]|nr:hypothetical protein [Roseiflexaceae bacterium]
MGGRGRILRGNIAREAIELVDQYHIEAALLRVQEQLLEHDARVEPLGERTSARLDIERLDEVPARTSDIGTIGMLLVFQAHAFDLVAATHANIDGAAQVAGGLIPVTNIARNRRGTTHLSSV